ncbi:putative Glyoxalase/Bleomycin resistance protein/Dihydroxybiphenyl dioxygenase [Vibrio nigripulchritudo SFn27]|uniref:Putative Glyoxalase/Bleomycin resistance protein/Dihydroxybiphenyl dioxygenase n=1 Tax=Vibrio nigripulchritudo TaxID=28173 RepID=U4KGC9_9VIBR|nr:VOC family protein [Vibrio nigripulchritudo]CCN85023.1 putative Glyoxalase/Bleomycin resistance protein/Dihydroxybiphenyl dioxygenase [Vibrio nigripulchritudo BLFn1]CCN90235.1 putative Glyoxalase/Bleomycin resistance protein/Dihydroxybiphenyl dioxygenase [Vibrio nigripulchritudo SFn27]CCN94153.1 putative Glyoxalase/Bleomycin resistance protein/Dihydroxybiphenyl dioxygenase [Vibrio nigripulchritudo ENn2]CCO42507.1 putative Glyoxalase/Bleomycin resistance protein/Dihydroxybiphenyl dioxygenase 
MSPLSVRKNLMPENMVDQLPEFMKKIEALAELIQIDLTDYQADHIALRINDSETAKAAHQAWLGWGKEISSAQINGRPIIVLAFNDLLNASRWDIECLELPYPAPGKIYPEESWEHVEFVIPSTAQSADDYLLFLQQQFPQFSQVLPQLSEMGVKMKLSSPKGEGERLPNPTVAFKYNGVCIKLHPHSLKDVVASEQSEL